jgi:hypothetical protein
LRRTHPIGDVRHVEALFVYHAVKVATALFLYTKPVNTLGGVTSEGL